MIPLDEIGKQADEAHLRCLEPWFQEGGPPAEMLAVCVSGDVAAARALVAQDPRLATIPSGEVTPLRLAAYYGHGELIELLLDHSARHDVAASHSKDFPLHLAARRGHSGAVEALIRRGADVNALSYGGGHFGITPLLASAQQENREVIHILAEAGADLEARSESGTALQMALFKGWSQVVEELVEKGANVNAEATPPPDIGWCIRTEDEWPLLDYIEGARPLYLAVCGWSEMVEFLLDHGADINGLSLGWSALHAAVVKPDRQMVELLLRRGANPHVKSNVNSPVSAEYNHRTPMDLLSGFRRSAQLLRSAKGSNGTDASVTPP
jgi:ankyrin repeat protein